MHYRQYRDSSPHVIPLQGSLGGTQETAYKYLQMLQATLRKALWCANEWLLFCVDSDLDSDKEAESSETA